MLHLAAWKSLCVGYTYSNHEGKRNAKVSLFPILFQLQSSYSFQKDVIAESPEILNLGLLFGEDVDATTTDLPEVLSFQHKLIQEYLAAIYITETLNQNPSSAFLDKVLTKWADIEKHREVVQFACSIVPTSGENPINNHAAKLLSEHIQNRINNGATLSKPLKQNLSLLSSFQKEGGVPLVNPYLIQYPACRKPLAEVLASTKVAVITGLRENDPLQLNSSLADIIIDIKKHREMSDRLWHALHLIHANVIALCLGDVKNVKGMKLGQFPLLKYLFLKNVDISEMKELAVSNDSRGPQPTLTYCSLKSVGLPREFVTALTRCIHLKYLCLISCNFNGKLSLLLASLPKTLRVLMLEHCSLEGGDIDQIAKALRDNKLTELQVLHLSRNPIGEAALHSLLEVISIRPNALKRLFLCNTGVDESGKASTLSKECLDKWRAKLTWIDINYTRS